MELNDAAALASAIVAVGAAGTSIWQAKIAKLGADIARRQYLKAESDAVLSRKAASFQAVSALGLAGLSVSEELNKWAATLNKDDNNAVLDAIERLRGSIQHIYSAWIAYTPLKDASPFFTLSKRLTNLVGATEQINFDVVASSADPTMRPVSAAFARGKGAKSSS